MQKSATIKDIASLVGVSTSTVSAVLGRKESRHVRVSEDTRGRILDAAERLKYRPNRIARSLRGERTNVIGLYAAYGYLNPHVQFTGQILGGLNVGCDENGKDLLVHGLYAGRRTDEIYGELADGWIDGLVVYTRADDPLVAQLAESILPAIGIIDFLPGLPCVVIDDAQGASLLAGHLHEKGHRDVVYISSSLPLVSVARRREAFLRAAEDLGMRVTERHPSSGHERFEPGDLEWLDLPKDRRPTAAACWNDMTAYFLLEECYRRRMSLPDDLAVVGFDGISPIVPIPWRLTTVRARWDQVTKTAVDLLVHSLEGAPIPLETALPVTFIAGDTT